eukprot:TRINITY_DN6011_c0_g1_i1.p1 TRINITY_DN6011_c0_g1~~TRINITY_DN6011_c0_g1_i1.p1  ORF type:complete len:595 (+),score=155.25 TRINITY_DN6011_c0_g1_i1:193-1785(+)
MASSASDEVKVKHEEEETKRFELKKQEELLRLSQADEHNTRLEQIKTEIEKKLIDYRLKKQTDTLKDKVKLKLEAQRQFNNYSMELLNKEKEVQEYKYNLEKQFQDRKYQQKKERIERELRLQAEMQALEEEHLAEHRLTLALKEHEAKKDWILHRDKKLQELKGEEDIKAEQVKWQSITDFFSGDEGKRRMYNISGLFVSVIGAYFGFKAGYPILQRALQNYFFKPKLISKRVRYSWWNRWLAKRRMNDTKVFFVPELQHRLESIVESTRNTSRRGGIFSNLLFYGKPGTGKTLFSEKLAYDSGIDFAMMSGPSFDQFKPHEAIVEIKNLFEWANRSKRGLLLFIDEADSFLEDRSTIHPKRVSVLNEWINQTGTESRKFMCVYETNRPENLDPAVQSRITQSLNFEPPTRQEILRMLTHYTNKYIVGESGRKGVLGFFSGPAKPIDASELLSQLEPISERIAAHNFVGRDVTNLVIALSQAAYAESEFKMTNELIDRVVDQQIKKKYKEKEYLEARAQRIASLRKRLV